MLGFAGFGTAKVGITWFTNVNAQFNEACMFEAKSSIVLPQQAIKKKLLEQTRDKLGRLIFHVWARTLFAKSSVTLNLNPSFIAIKVDATFSFKLNSTT